MSIRALLLASALALTACTTAPRASSTPPPTISAQATESPGGTGVGSVDDVDMCSLMPLGDVQAKSPFQTPLALATPDVDPAGCTYTSAIDAEEPVSVGLVVTGFESPADALTVLHNDRQAIVDAGLPVADLSGLGDEAFTSGSDEVGVRAVVGAVYVEAHFKGEWPDTTDDAKVAAATELVRTIISRLP